MRIPTNSLFRQQMQTLNKQYELLVKYAGQISSGKKINDASEDPILASHIKMTEDYISGLQIYDGNGVIAQSRTSLFESSMKNVVDIIDQVKVQMKAAQNDTLTNSDRSEITKKLEGLLTGLLNNANIRDGSGQYIYGGINTGTQPYVLSNGKYVYQGQLSSTTVNIDSINSVLFNESGHSVFGDIYNGNGAFTIKGASSNTGTAYASPGSIVDRSAYVADTYTVTFALDGSNNIVYTVNGATSGQVIPPLPSTTPYPYTAGSPITFNGISIPFTGTPAAGDTFQVAPSEKQNVFDSLQQVIDLLKTPINNDTERAAFHQELSQLLGSFEQSADHMRGYLSEVGTRSSLLNSQVASNKNAVLSQNSMLSKLSDTNMDEVISAYMRQMVSLQATQQSYMKLQEVMSQIIRF